MCPQSLHMLCSNKHLDMYVLCIDIFNKQADIFPFRIAKYDILSQCSVRCSSQSRDALVWRALMSRPGARKWSAHNWFGARAATMHKARCGATTAYCAWLEGIFTKKTRAQLHIRPWDMTPRHHNQLHPSPEQRTVQELEHAALTRAWTRGRHTSHVTLHVTHHTSSFCTVFLLLATIFLQTGANTNAKYKIARVTAAKT